MSNGRMTPGPRAGVLPAIGLLTAVVILVACSPGGKPSDPGTAAAPGQATTTGPKTLRIAMTAEREPKGGVVPIQGSLGWREYGYTFHAGLAAIDAQDNVLPRLAQKVPSVADGDWKLLPDGQMEVTWRLRTDAKWHDGVLLTAADFAFGSRVTQDPEYPWLRSDASAFISDVLAPDPSTVLVRWKQTYVFGNVSAPSDVVALPRHLMEDLYESGAKQAFFNSPLWRGEFVGLGPYRVADWVEGIRIEGTAFDDYVLGRAKIDRVIFQFVGDTNALLVTLLSGAADMTTYGNFRLAQFAELRNAWEPTAAGTTFMTFSGIRQESFQFRNPDTPWARNLSLRRSMAHMLDRQAIADAILGPGLSSPADTIVHPTNPVYPLLEQRGLTKYPFDLAQAERLMMEAGWVRTPGGAYRSSSGEPLAIDLAFDGNSEKEAQAVAGQWNAAGIAETPLSPIPESAPRAEKDQLRHASKGVLGFSVRDDLLSLAKFTTAEIGTPSNRYQGANHGGYTNPEYDRLYNQALVTLNVAPRQGLTADFLKLVADDVPMIGLYYDPGQAEGAARKGIRGPGAPSSMQLQVAWNIHEWDMD